MNSRHFNHTQKEFQNFMQKLLEFLNFYHHLKSSIFEASFSSENLNM